MEAEAKKSGKRVKIVEPERPASPKKKKAKKKKKKADIPVIPPIPRPIDERYEKMPLHLEEKLSAVCLTTDTLERQQEVFS